jgi:hypothetical protein
MEELYKTPKKRSLLMRLLSKTFVGELMIRLKPDIKRDLILFGMTMGGGFLAFKWDAFLVGINIEYRILAVPAFILLGYAIRYMQSEVLSKLWNKDEE